jgi:hypothetical protein
MICKFIIVAGAFLTIAVVVSSASALTIGPHSKSLPATEDSLAQPAQWGYCAHWRRVCSERWGWNTSRFYLCLKRRNCDFPF